jgi:hypothetical protein
LIAARPGTLEFQTEYDALVEASTSSKKTELVETPKFGTYRWLCEQYLRSTDFKQLDPKTQHVRRQVLEHTWAEPIAPGAKETFADFPISRMSTKAVRVLRDRKGGFPQAANVRVKAIRRLFRWALDALISASDGHLAHVRGGWLHFTQQKNRNRRPITLELPILPVLQRIIDASTTGDLTFLVNEYGQPFTANGFGNRMREWCDEAGLPHCTSHGLRKTGAAIAAENGATAHELMSIFGWLTLKEAERYTRAAETKEDRRAGNDDARERGEKGTGVTHRYRRGVTHQLISLENLALWRPVGESNPCFQRERLAS